MQRTNEEQPPQDNLSLKRKAAYYGIHHVVVHGTARTFLSSENVDIHQSLSRRARFEPNLLSVESVESQVRTC